MIQAYLPVSVNIVGTANHIYLLTEDPEHRKQRNILFFANGHISGALYIGNYYILRKSALQLLVAVDISVRWWICVI